LLIAVDVLFSFTILQPHAASKVNTSCFHSCSDQCLTVCSIDDHGNSSGGGGGLTAAAASTIASSGAASTPAGAHRFL
jgi:hypothetical protein